MVFVFLACFNDSIYVEAKLQHVPRVQFMCWMKIPLILSYLSRKKFRADVLKAFPAITEDAFNECIPNKEPVSVMKVYTHTKQAVHVYSIEKGPIAFEMENKLFPALYLLWQFPDLVPAFTTWPPVCTNYT